MDRTIFDKTGLTGKYDFTLEWTPDDAPPAMTGGAPPPDAGGPSLFTALEEQLGLKLEPQKGPVDVVVIDHIERRFAELAADRQSKKMGTNVYKSHIYARLSVWFDSRSQFWRGTTSLKSCL